MATVCKSCSRKQRKRQNIKTFTIFTLIRSKILLLPHCNKFTFVKMFSPYSIKVGSGFDLLYFYIIISPHKMYAYNNK